MIVSHWVARQEERVKVGARGQVEGNWGEYWRKRGVDQRGEVEEKRGCHVIQLSDV